MYFAKLVEGSWSVVTETVSQAVKRLAKQNVERRTILAFIGFVRWLIQFKIGDWAGPLPSDIGLMCFLGD